MKFIIQVDPTLDELKDKSQVGQTKESTEQSATVESPSITQKEVNNTSLK